MSISDQEEVNSETQTQEFLRAAISKASDVIIAVSEAYKEPWNKNSSTGVRAVFGHWLAKAVRHFAATIILCETHDLSMVANVHHRQMFEILLQIRYFSSFDQDKKEYLAEKIKALGCLEFLDKLEPLKDRNDVKKGYDEVLELLSHTDKNIIADIKCERSARIYSWFGCSFSRLAKNVSKEGEDLQRIYQIISPDIHGAWDLAIKVTNLEPGVLDFRGYPDKSTMYRWAADLLDQVTSLYLKIWNEVAVAVGAPKLYL